MLKGLTYMNIFSEWIKSQETFEISKFLDIKNTQIQKKKYETVVNLSHFN